MAEGFAGLWGFRDAYGTADHRRLSADSSHFTLFNVGTSIVITYICRMKIEQAIKQERFDNEYQKLAVNMMYTSSLLSVHQQRFFRGYDLTVQQYNVLRILRGQKSTPIGVNSIGERMIDQTSNASRLVEKLRQKGLAERKTCPDDRRQVEVTITQNGMNLLAEIDSHMHELFKAFGSISHKEAANLNQLLDKLRSNSSFYT